MKTHILISYLVLSTLNFNSYSFVSNEYNLSFKFINNFNIESYSNTFCNDFVRIPSELDSSYHKKKYKFFQFDDKLNNLYKMDIDSLIKRYKVEVDIDKYLNEDFLKKFDDNSQRFWRDFPKLDKQKLDELLKELNKKLDKDSLLNRFKFFRKKDLFDEKELIEI